MKKAVLRLLCKVYFKLPTYPDRIRLEKYYETDEKKTFSSTHLLCHYKAPIVNKLLTLSTYLNLLKLARFNKLTQLKQSGANLPDNDISQWPCRTEGCLGRHRTGCSCRECISLEDRPTYSLRTHYTAFLRSQS